MRLLIINLDKSIFKPCSRSLADLKDYSRCFEKLFVIVWTRAKEESIFFEDKLFIYPTNSLSRLFYIFDTYRIFRKFLKKEKIDLVSSQDPFETGLTAWLISSVFKAPLHLQAHVDFLSPYFWKESLVNKVRVILAKFLIPRAKCIRVVSQRIKNSLDLRFKNKDLRISTLPIFVDIERIQNAPIKIDLHQKYPQFDFIILMASRFTKEKNIEMAIDVVRKLPKVGLVIVGEGPEAKNLRSQISNLKINDKIIIEPWTDDLISYYKTADLFLLTSNYEGYGMTLVEAAAVGCNIISSDVGVADEILEKDNIFKVNNEEGLKGKIIDVIKGNIKPPRLLRHKTRRDYLEEYEKSWLNCG